MASLNPSHTQHEHATFTREEHARFRQLQAKPVIAVPTLLLFITGWAVAITLAHLTLQLHVLPLTVGAVLAGITGYFLFSPIHDALHRSVSKYEWINDVVAIGTVNLMLPYVSHKLLRWGHMQHHRFTNEVGRDPDASLTHKWHAPITMWAFFELFYVPDYWRHRHERPRNEAVQVIAQLLVGFVLLGLLFWWQGVEFAIYWLLASRLTLWLIVAVFVWLPHQPHNIMQKDHLYQATLLRTGKEWLLTPLMAYQNWHLVHHLYPNVPFYRYKRVWQAREAFHESHKPARVRAFQLIPDADQLPTAKH